MRTSASSLPQQPGELTNLDRLLEDVCKGVAEKGSWARFAGTTGNRRRIVTSSCDGEWESDNVRPQGPMVRLLNSPLRQEESEPEYILPVEYEAAAPRGDRRGAGLPKGPRHRLGTKTKGRPLIALI